MAEAVLVALAFASSYVGLALFALRQKPHHAAVAASATRAGPSRAARTRFLVLGSAALAASLAASVTAEGPSFGSIVWVLELACAGVGVTFTLSYRPRWLRALWSAVARA